MATESEQAKLRKLAAENKRLRRELKEARARKKREFSKIIFVGVSAGTVAITIYSCVIIWRTMDTSALAYLIPAVFAEMASATGFYYTKAKAENKIKLMSKHGVNPDALDDEAEG